MERFEKLGLSKEILKVLDEIGFENPTEIQEKTIPLALAGKDIIAGSATGSGKTLAFSSPIIENLKPGSKVQALILTPTRELAEQVAESVRRFSKNKNLNVLAVYGGVDIGSQIKRLPNTDVVVGTPGRILDHINKKTLILDNIKILVLDECDRMFDMGFHKDVETIIRYCPKNRQTMLFSATISSDIDHFSKKYTKEAAEVSVNSYVDPSKLKQIYYDVQPNIKFSLLVHLLKRESSDLVMVFCSTRRNADFVTNNLKKMGIYSKVIHGGLPQNKRLRVLNEFHGKGVSVLICTDVAARGLDIKGVSHIYNYDIPSTSKDYVHRIGRTARAGKDGKVINILSSRDYENFRNISDNDSLKITQEQLPFINVVKLNTEVGGRDSGRFRSNDRFRGRSNDRGGRFNRGRDNSRGGRFNKSRDNNRGSRFRSNDGPKRGDDNRSGRFGRGRNFNRDSGKRSESRGRFEKGFQRKRNDRSFR